MLHIYTKNGNLFDHFGHKTRKRWPNQGFGTALAAREAE